MLMISIIISYISQTLWQVLYKHFSGVILITHPHREQYIRVLDQEEMKEGRRRAPPPEPLPS